MSNESVLVLAGGPDAERDVSIHSAGAIAGALRDAGRTVHLHTINEPTLEELRDLPGDTVFPALHGRWGEGGRLQDLLDSLGRPYAGSGPRAARLAMDKIATKSVAATLNIATSPSVLLDPADDVAPIGFPFVAKPVFEGSTVGLVICRGENDWTDARALAHDPRRPYMLEPFACGRELTVGMIPGPGGLRALAPIEIAAADGLYDYEAKYNRDDTTYIVDPELPAGIASTIQRQTAELADRLGIRDLCRADFILDDDQCAWLLEINTMPGFTGHSLVPMAARAEGIEMPELCELILRSALARAASGAGVLQQSQPA